MPDGMRILAVTSFSLMMVSLWGCSSTSSGGGTNAGTDSGVGADSGVSAINGCTTFADDTTGAETDLVWDFAIATDPNRCVKIKVGAKVKFTGDFGKHPLTGTGGDSPNPISTITIEDAGTSTSVIVTFPKAGTFGYLCGNHQSMTGAIEVVP